MILVCLLPIKLIPHLNLELVFFSINLFLIARSITTPHIKFEYFELLTNSIPIFNYLHVLVIVGNITINQTGVKNKTVFLF